MEHIEELEVQANGLRKDLEKLRATRSAMPQLAGRAEQRERQLRGQSNNLVLFLPCDWLWPPQCKQPLCIRELPEVQLWAAKMRLQAVGILHLDDLPLIRRKTNRIQREGRRLMLHFERILIHPYRYFFTSQSVLSVEFPMFEPDISMLVEMTE